MIAGEGTASSSGSVSALGANGGQSGSSGRLSFSSGTATTSNSGTVCLGSGTATAGGAGSARFAIGSGASGRGGAVAIGAGRVARAEKTGGIASISTGCGVMASSGTIMVCTANGGDAGSSGRLVFSSGSALAGAIAIDPAA